MILDFCKDGGNKIIQDLKDVGFDVTVHGKYFSQTRYTYYHGMITFGFENIKTTIRFGKGNKLSFEISKYNSLFKINNNIITFDEDELKQHILKQKLKSKKLKEDKNISSFNLILLKAFVEDYLTTNNILFEFTEYGKYVRWVLRKKEWEEKRILYMLLRFEFKSFKDMSNINLDDLVCHNDIKLIEGSRLSTKIKFSRLKETLNDTVDKIDIELNDIYKNFNLEQLKIDALTKQIEELSKSKNALSNKALSIKFKALEKIKIEYD